MRSDQPPVSTLTRPTLPAVEGACIAMADGRRLLDFASGLDAPIGHGWATGGWSAIPAALAAGAEADLAARLTETSFAERVRLTGSAATAAELALCAMWRYHELRKRPKRRRIITFANGWHGDAPLLDLATGGKAFERALDPLGSLFDIATFNDLSSVHALVGPQTAGILVEPLQRRGTFEPPQNGFLMGLRAIADEYDLVLAHDETASGLGRTGLLWAHAWSGAPPDLMILGTNLGGGSPFGALLATERLGKALETGTDASGSHVPGLAAAHGFLDRLLAPGFLEGIEELGWLLEDRLRALAYHHPSVIELSYGMGLWQTLRTRVSAAVLQQALLDHGLIAIAGVGNHLALVPPLTVTAGEIATAAAAIDAACTAVTPPI